MPATDEPTAPATRSPTTPAPQLPTLARLQREFTAARDWGRFHDPKSLILALVGEVGELAEHFQWVPADEAVAGTDPTDHPTRHARVAEEMADVLLYLVRLADILDVDLYDAATRKLAASWDRFPADDVRGVAPAKG